MASRVSRSLRMLASVVFLAPGGAVAQSPDPFVDLFGGEIGGLLDGSLGEFSPGADMSFPDIFSNQSGNPIEQLEGTLDLLLGLAKALPPDIRGAIPCPDPFSEAGGIGLLQSVGSDVDLQSMLADFETLRRISTRLDAERDTLPCLDKIADFLAMSVHALEGRPAEAEAIAERLLPPPGQPFGDILQLSRVPALVLQDRPSELEAITERAIVASRSTAGPGHHLTIATKGTLGDIALASGNAARAREIYARVRSDAIRHLGEGHTLACIATASEGIAAARLNDLDAASTLLGSALAENNAPCARSIDAQNPWRMRWNRELADIYRRQGRLEEAEHHIDAAMAAIDRSERAPENAETLAALVTLRRDQGRIDDAVAAVEDLMDTLYAWLGLEVWSTSSRTIRAGLIDLRRRHQELAMHLGLAHPGHPAAQEAAARAILRFKGLKAEEDAALDRLIRDPDVPANVRALSETVRERRIALAALIRLDGVHGLADLREFERRTRELDLAEAALARESPAFRNRPGAKTMLLEQVQSALAARDDGAVLVEYMRIMSESPGITDAPRAERWAAVIIAPDEVRTVDLGLAAPVDARISILADPESDVIRHELRRLADLCAAPRSTAANMLASLYTTLVEPLDLPSDRRVILSPDHILGLLPFAALCTPQGDHWIEAQMLEFVQNGRALLPREDADRAEGFLGLGIAEFGNSANAQGSRQPRLSPLPAAVEEVRVIGEMMTSHGETSVSVLENAAARKALLLDLRVPPRVLHLSTHGRYFADEINSDRALVRAAIALAGAGDPDIDGYMSALEVRNLDLEGTELVVLSACQSALGPPELNEGVAGMVRAFRLAGARHSLVALRNVSSHEASAVMERFYAEWLKVPGVTPVDALNSAIRGLIAEKIPVDWTAYALFSG